MRYISKYALIFGLICMCIMIYYNNSQIKTLQIQRLEIIEEITKEEKGINNIREIQLKNLQTQTIELQEKQSQNKELFKQIVTNQEIITNKLKSYDQMFLKDNKDITVIYDVL